MNRLVFALLNRAVLERLLAAFVAALLPALPASGMLVGHWNFDEGSGTTINDASGAGNHGVLINPGTFNWTNGVQGGALYFDGTTGAGATYVTIPDAASLRMTNAVSFAAWVKCDDVSRDAPILDKEGDGKLSYWFGAFGAGSEGASPGSFGVLLSLNGAQPWSIYDRNQGSISQGLWVHVASTWDGTTIRHYLNGVLLPETAAFNGPLHVSDAALIIGANYPYNKTAFKGCIDEVRLYNHALTLDEVRTLAGVVPRLVGHWTFDEGSGTNITDSSGLASHGTLIHPKTNTWTAGIKGSALYFDGTTGAESTYVAIPDTDALRIASGISFSAWVRCDDVSRDAPILAKEGSGKLSYWFGTYGISSGGSAPGNFGTLLSANGKQWAIQDRDQGVVPLGQWVHLASTWDGIETRHYMNGDLVAGGQLFSGPIYVSDAFLAIGANSLYNFTAFKGAIDEVSLYNYALSSEEVREICFGTAFKIVSFTREGVNARVSWQCLPGRSYVVQTNVVAPGGGLSGTFADLSGPVAVPAGFTGSTTDYLHVGAALNGGAIYYRVKLLP
jgi:hypothetical protein